MAIISHVPVTYPYHASGRVRSQPMAQWILLKEKGEFIETWHQSYWTVTRFVNFDFALVQVLLQQLRAGVQRVVISYDIACKYSIHFMKRIIHSSWPLVTPDEWRRLQRMEIVWLVPKFHLAAHIEGCTDRFSFNWTKDVGRTCGESVESNWASLNGLATSSREMGLVTAETRWRMLGVIGIGVRQLTKVSVFILLGLYRSEFIWT